MTSRLPIVAVTLLLLALCPPLARADVTVFAGATGTIAGHEPMAGAAVSWFPAPIDLLRFEREGWDTTGGSRGGRNVSVFGARLIVQAPERRRVRPYVAVGAGLYGETARDGSGGSGAASGRHVGGGAKVRLRGPLAVRMEYRQYFVGAPDAGRNFVMRRHPPLLTVGVAITF